MKEMFNIIWMLLGLLMLAIPFIDNVLFRPTHKKKLQLQFETWWKIVKHYDRLKLALIFANKANDLLDGFFGKKLLSKKVLLRCVIISNSLLIIALSWVGFTNGETFGVTPWKNYKSSVSAAESVLDGVISQYDLAIYSVIDITNGPPFSDITNALLSNKFTAPVKIITNAFIVNIGTNTCFVKLSKDAVATMEQIEPLGHGGVEIHYVRRFGVYEQTNVSTNVFGNVSRSQNPYIELKNDASLAKRNIAEYDNLKCIVTYSLAYFTIVFSANTLLFITSLVLCRIMLREIALCGRLVSTIALVIANLVALICVTCGVLLFFSILAIPLIWFLFPVMYMIANESIYTFCVFLCGECFAAWELSGISAKLIALITFLPNVFAGIVGLFSVLAMRWKNGFHFICSGILIRCVENSPIAVIFGTIVFITGLIALLAKCLHLTSFL